MVELLHPGPAHTYGDTMVYLPQEKVLFSGDVAFHYLTPLARDGHVSNWIKVANGILNHLDVTTLMPGHGPVSGKEVFHKTLQYLRLVKRASRSHFNRGSSGEDTHGREKLSGLCHRGRRFRNGRKIAPPGWNLTSTQDMSDFQQITLRMDQPANAANDPPSPTSTGVALP